MLSTLTEALSFRTTLRKPLLKLILMLTLVLVPLGMISEVVMMTFIWMNESIAIRSLCIFVVLACHLISMIVYFSTLGIPGIMMGARQALDMSIDLASIKADCYKVKNKLLKLTMTLAIATVIICPGITFLTFPDNFDSLVERYVIYT